MKFRFMTVALLLASAPMAIMQSGAAESGNEQHVPRLADIMSTTQLRHMKLWFAGASSNWNVAAYELRQLKESLVEAASLYPGIPVTNVTTMAEPVQALADALEAKNARSFTSAFGLLTNGCNACHQSMGRGFIVMKVPTVSPFSDQVFTPRDKP
jgi:hypothetical protein